jgi:hypothetical protein
MFEDREPHQAPDDGVSQDRRIPHAEEPAHQRALAEYTFSGRLNIAFCHPYLPFD